MSDTFKTGRADPLAASSLDADAVRAAYRRWAGVYDNVFGAISGPARRAAVAAVNRAPGLNVLEVGVGTGLSLPGYASGNSVYGVDISAEMLKDAGAEAVIVGHSERRADHGETDAVVVSDLYTDTLGDAPLDTYVAVMRSNVDRVVAALTRP